MTFLRSDRFRVQGLGLGKIHGKMLFCRVDFWEGREGGTLHGGFRVEGLRGGFGDPKYRSGLKAA